MTQVWMSAAALCATTMLGALLGFGIKRLSHKWTDTILGYCAGVMLAASTLGLIVPAFDQVPGSGWWMVVAGVMLGALFLNILDGVTPHLHHITGLEPERHASGSSLNRVLLFVLAIAIHKLPEGIAAGVSMTPSSDGNVSWSVTMGLALQNIPEGMVIIAPLLVAGVSVMRTVGISLAIGTLGVIGVWIGFALGSFSLAFLPVILGFAGGAMLYVTSNEMIPETHAHGFQEQATYALLLGFMTLLLLERSFG